MIFPLSARTLLRVLPLPGDNWGALVDEWCCHPDPFANKPLHPRENDCFTGDCFYLVNLKSDLWQDSLASSPMFLIEPCRATILSSIKPHTHHTPFYARAFAHASPSAGPRFLAVFYLAASYSSFQSQLRPQFCRRTWSHPVSQTRSAPC